MRLTAVLPAFTAVLLAISAWAEVAPLPRPRLPETDKQLPLSIELDPIEVQAAKKICEDLFKANVAIATPEEPIAWDNGCTAAAPVRVTAFKLPSGKIVDLRPAGILRCPMALTIAKWVREDLTPAAEKLGTTIERIDVAASFGCRSRNNVFGAVLSEHGKANAFDIRSLHFVDGREVIIENGIGSQEFLSTMRKSACDRFTTVLGPGSDKWHEFHLHVDLAERQSNYKMCQWILPTPENLTSHYEQGSKKD